MMTSYIIEIIIKNLHRSYLKYPNVISAIRVHKIIFKSDNTIDAYNNWEINYEGKKFYNTEPLLTCNWSWMSSLST